jgi:predicted lipoprotein with Yx(FWY)xxD motif
MRKVVVGAALAALAVVLTACGGGDDQGSGATATTAAAQPAAEGTVAVAGTGLGEVLVDAKGRTLYVFTKDKGDQSVCSGKCAAAWPALTVTGAATPGTGVQASLLSGVTAAWSSPRAELGRRAKASQRLRCEVATRTHHMRGNRAIQAVCRRPGRPALAAVPAFPDNIVAFPNRDFGSPTRPSRPRLRSS